MWINYATRHSVEHDDDKKYIVKNNYYVKFFANESDAIDEYFDFTCFFTVIDEDTNEEVEVTIPCILNDNTLYIHDDWVVEDMNELSIEDINDVLYNVSGNIEKVLL